MLAVGLARATIALALAAVVMVGSTVTASTVAAHDAAQPAASQGHEWRHVKAGMKKARVHAIFDSRGRLVDGFAGGYTRRYRPCAWNGGTDLRLYVSYDGFTRRVIEKRVV